MVIDIITNMLMVNDIINMTIIGHCHPLCGFKNGQTRDYPGGVARAAPPAGSDPLPGPAWLWSTVDAKKGVTREMSPPWPSITPHYLMSRASI